MFLREKYNVKVTRVLPTFVVLALYIPDTYEYNVKRTDFFYRILRFTRVSDIITNVDGVGISFFKKKINAPNLRLG